MADKKNLARYMGVVDFLARHPGYYDQYEEECIKSYALRENERNFYLDIMREIYDELGFIPDEKNMYITFIKMIEETFGIEGKNIIEVGGGIIPRLGKRIHLKQNTGTITVYDPRLGRHYESEDRFTLVREEFTKKTPVDGADLIVGLMPCKGAEPLLDQAIKNNIDFILWFCEGGPHGDYFDYFEDDDEWLSSTLYFARKGVEENKMGKLKVKHLEQFSTYPIVYNEREK